MPQCSYQSRAPSDISTRYMTKADQQHALKLLEERRLWDPEYKPPNPLSKLFKSKAKLIIFSPQEIDRAFRDAVRENASLGLIEAYIRFGASVDIRPANRLCKWTNRARAGECCALQLAIPSGSEDLFRLLAVHADHKSKNEALVTTIDLHDESKTQVLFELGADPLAFDTAVCRAAARLDKKTLSFLAHWASPSRDVYTLAFARAIQGGEQWYSDIGLSVLRLLLEQGAEGDVVNVAFLQAVQLFLLGRAAEALVDLLLAYSADVDFNEGEAVKRTIEAGEVDFLKKLMGSNPSTNTLTDGLFGAILDQHPPERFVEISKILTTGDQQPLLTWRPDPDLPLLILALQQYPNSPAVVHQLLEMGAEVDAQLTWQVVTTPKLEEGYGIAEDESESDEADEIPPDCNYATGHTGSTPLLLASRRGRPDLVRLFLQQNVDVSLKDSLGRSPLFGAARLADIESVRLLIENQARVNDGSLHEAARQLNQELVSILLDAGHDPNFTSTKHNGLTALGELAMFCKASGRESAAEECIELLVQAGADPLKKCRGETVLYNALQNPDPFPITSVLVERLFWKYLAHEANICSGQDLFYSPTMCLQKGYFAVSNSVRESLIQLLKNHGAEDTYYAAEGLRQPSDAVGVPPDILASERRRRLHEEEMQRRLEEHQATLRQQLELAQQRLRLQEARQQQSLRHRWESAEQDYEVQEMQQQQYLRHQAEQFEDKEHYMTTMAHAHARLQEDKDYQRIQSELELLEIERESVSLRIEEENHKLEIQWQVNEAQAESAHDKIVHQQQLRYFDEARWDEAVASNYIIQEQTVRARALLAMIADRSHPDALAMLQADTIAKFSQQCANSQLLLED